MKIIIPIMALGLGALGVYSWVSRDQLAARLTELTGQLNQTANQTKDELSQQGQQFQASFQAVRSWQDVLGQKTASLVSGLQAQVNEAETKNAARVQAAEQQTKVAVNALEELKNGALAKLQDTLAELQETETQLVLLKKEQVAAANKDDNRWRDEGRRLNAKSKSGVISD